MLKSTHKPEASAHTSRFSRNMRSKPTLQNDGLSRVQSPYSTPHHPDPQPAEMRTIDGWIRELPEEFSDVDGGIVNDLMRLALSYLEQIKLPAMKHRSAVSVLEEHQHRMCLLKDDSKLDTRLAEAPQMRKLFVSNLLSLVLLLSTGINLVTAGNRQSLRDDTSQIVEQASAIAFVHLQGSTHCLPNTILEFLDATKSEIKSKIDNVSDPMPATHHPVPDFHRKLSPQIEETGPEETVPDIPKPSGPDRLVKIARRPSKSLRSIWTSMVGSSSTSQDGEDSGRLRSESSKSSSKHSSRFTNFLSIFSGFSNPSHIRPSSDTATSISLLGANTSISESTASTSTRAPTKGTNCNAFSDEAEQVTKIDNAQRVMIWHRKKNVFVEKKMIFDTGCDYNIIRRSVADELRLEFLKRTPMKLRCFNNLVFQVKQAVVPEWHFSGSSTKRWEYVFLVVPNIPGGVDIVVGNRTRSNMNVHLYVNGALVAFENPEDVPTQEQSKRQRRKQDHDEIKTDNITEHEIAAKLADVVQQKQAAAKASNHSRSRNATSQRDPGDSGEPWR